MVRSTKAEGGLASSDGTRGWAGMEVRGDTGMPEARLPTGVGDFQVEQDPKGDTLLAKMTV